jgi:hypothetical protein
LFVVNRAALIRNSVYLTKEGRQKDAKKRKTERRGKKEEREIKREKD